MIGHLSHMILSYSLMIPREVEGPSNLPEDLTVRNILPCTHSLNRDLSWQDKARCLSLSPLGEWKRDHMELLQWEVWSLDTGLHFIPHHIEVSARIGPGATAALSSSSTLNSTGSLSFPTSPVVLLHCLSGGKPFRKGDTGHHQLPPRQLLGCGQHWLQAAEASWLWGRTLAVHGVSRACSEDTATTMISSKAAGISTTI